MAGRVPAICASTVGADGRDAPYGMHTSQIYLLYQAHTAMQERYGGSAERLLTSEKTLALPGNLPGTAKRSSGCDITCVHPVGRGPPIPPPPQRRGPGQAP